jgi:hypothetical protein
LKNPKDLSSIFLANYLHSPLYAPAALERDDFSGDNSSRDSNVSAIPTLSLRLAIMLTSDAGPTAWDIETLEPDYSEIYRAAGDVDESDNDVGDEVSSAAPETGVMLFPRASKQPSGGRPRLT